MKQLIPLHDEEWGGEASPERQQVLAGARERADALVLYCEQNNIGTFRQNDDDSTRGELTYIPPRTEK